ncbi:MAG TPA: hypothetical protein VF315_03360, partial [Steroidobacteraceae bacterium]
MSTSATPVIAHGTHAAPLRDGAAAGGSGAAAAPADVRQLLQNRASGASAKPHAEQCTVLSAVPQFMQKS